ncbi:hypothetical protein NJB95_07475 [Brucella intermedia]|uniref:hypothetical protein n=1 Tax=Brucella intermedia TaxID=94625 RepID=UPI00165D1F8C|nr:hypothetical protein [Brucella intermedia]MCO7736450.1 hypothetical protein [Brucella intermedia]QNQ40044.1 hypothetical protein IAR37_11945 [Brucella intermedia]
MLDDTASQGKSPSDPTIDEILKEISRFGEPVSTDRPEPLEVVEQESSWVDHELAYAKLSAFQSHHQSKKQWSNFMIFIMGMLILFQMVLLMMVGWGWWDFTKYDWLLPMLLVQNFAQIVGLALVVVRSLFDSFKE